MKKTISFLVIFCMIVSLMPVFAEDSIMTRDELIDNFAEVEESVKTAAKSEYGYASNKSSSNLAWAASYMMESYYHMYVETGNKEYLKSLGEQYEEALRNLNYDYGENLPGWDAPNYSVKRITAANSDFNGALSIEDPTSTAENIWLRKYESDASNVNIEDGCGVSNGKGLHLVAGNSKPQGVLHNFPEYAGNTIYEVGFSAKGNADFRMYLLNHRTGEVIPTLSGDEYTSVSVSASSWKSFAIRFRVPSDGSALSLHFEIPETCESGDIYLDSVTFKQAAQFQVHDTMVMAAGAKFMLAVYSDEVLAAEKFDKTRTFKEVADSFLPVTELLVHKWDPHWREVGTDMGVYVWPMDDSSNYAGNTLPHNQYIKMACVMMPLYEITKKEEYLNKAERMLRFFKSTIISVGEGDDAYCYWHYYDPAFDNEKPQSSNSEDISHGCLELDAAIMGYERGIVFDESDMKKIANAFTTMLWDGNLENPVLYNYLSNDPQSSRYHVKMTSASNVRDWARLGKWNRDIAVAIVNFMSHNNPRSGHPTKMLAYAYALPYIYNPLQYIRVKIIENKLQIEGYEKPVTFEVVTNDGIDKTILENTVWTVKTGITEFASGKGESFTFTPDGSGGYTVSAVLNGYSSEYRLLVYDENHESGGAGAPTVKPEGGEEPDDNPNGDTSEDEGGTSGGSGNTPSGGGGGSPGGSGGSSRPSGGSSGGGGGGGGGGSFVPSNPREEEPAEEVAPEEEKEESSDDLQKKEFHDVKKEDWFCDAVDHVVEKGYMSGVSDNDFNPSGNMTRAMLAKVLHNMKKNPEAVSDKEFSDVKSGEWYTDAILWAAESGIVTGYGNGNYGTHDNITREQLAVMLWRFSESPTSTFEISFADADKISPWAVDAMRWAVEKGILNGKSESILSPETFATRAEVAQMLKNFSKAFEE